VFFEALCTVASAPLDGAINSKPINEHMSEWGEWMKAQALEPDAQRQTPYMQTLVEMCAARTRLLKLKEEPDHHEGIVKFLKEPRMDTFFSINVTSKAVDAIASALDATPVVHLSEVSAEAYKPNANPGDVPGVDGFLDLVGESLQKRMDDARKTGGGSHG
jgi:hypothetical protein